MEHSLPFRPRIRARSRVGWVILEGQLIQFLLGLFLKLPFTLGAWTKGGVGLNLGALHPLPFGPFPRPGEVVGWVSIVEQLARPLFDMLRRPWTE